jgi:LuxR family transcriptional regulator, maltose regulon positive regulatory protein
VIHELLAGFPAGQLAADAELAAVAAGDELARGSLEAAERYLGLAERAPVPDGRAGQAQLLLGIVRLLLARQRGDQPAVAEEAQRLPTMAEGEDPAQPALGEELRALALISLGSAEYWAAGADAGRYLERGLTLVRRIGRPYLEFTGLAHQAAVVLYESFTRSAEHATAAVELARRHGWTGDPAFGLACGRWRRPGPVAGAKTRSRRGACCAPGRCLPGCGCGLRTSGCWCRAGCRRRRLPRAG